VLPEAAVAIAEQTEPSLRELGRCTQTRNEMMVMNTGSGILTGSAYIAQPKKSMILNQQ
jgi:hypothetical protein